MIASDIDRREIKKPILCILALKNTLLKTVMKSKARYKNQEDPAGIVPKSTERFDIKV